jgi:hypothetical protein
MIMVALRSLIYVVTTSLLYQLGVASSTPIQVELIFPKNNTVYQPVYPFPIVYAVHNFSKLWKYQPTLTWQLWELYPAASAKISYDDGFVGWDFRKAPATWTPPPDTFLAINSSVKPSRKNESVWMIEHNFYLASPDCNSTPIRKDWIYFNTSIDTGIMPILSASNTCLSPWRTISIGDRDQSNDTCTPTYPEHPPTSCAFSVDEQVVDQISRQMVINSGCKNVTWPNSTGIGYRCDQFQRYDPVKISDAWRRSSTSIGLLVIIISMLSFRVDLF